MCAEPFNMRPWEVGRLTPFQLRQVLLCDRDKKTGAPILDPPLGEDDQAELSMASEWRTHYRQLGVTDPDAIAYLVRAALAAEGIEED